MKFIKNPELESLQLENDKLKRQLGDGLTKDFFKSELVKLSKELELKKEYIEVLKEKAKLNLEILDLTYSSQQQQNYNKAYQYFMKSMNLGVIEFEDDYSEVMTAIEIASGTKK